MAPLLNKDLTVRLVEKARSLGASSAGIASLSSLIKAPSYEALREVRWRGQSRSVLVLALRHEAESPALDWWIGKGGTEGNRILQRIADRLRKWLREELDIGARHLPYHVEKGGVFLKDAGVLAGLGIIGRNNLLVTPGVGPRIRLRALLLDAELPPTGPLNFAPCEACDGPCMSACPQGALKDGSYNMAFCRKQMRLDQDPADCDCIKYCRSCELSCVVGN